MKMAKPGETLDMTEPSSEAFDQQEVVVLTGETAQRALIREARVYPQSRTFSSGAWHDAFRR